MDTNGVEYETIDGDYIDAIVFKHYGFVDRALEAVMNSENNRHLRNKDDSLPSGVVIFLPVLPPEDRRVVRLWD